MCIAIHFKTHTQIISVFITEISVNDQLIVGGVLKMIIFNWWCYSVINIVGPF